MPGCVATHISKRSGGKDSPFPFYPSSCQPFPIRPIHLRDSPRWAPDPPQENGHRQAWQRQHHRHLHYQPAVLLPLAFPPRHPRARQRHSSSWPSSYPSCQPAPYSTYHHHHRLFCRLRRHHCCHPPPPPPPASPPAPPSAPLLSPPPLGASPAPFFFLPSSSESAQDAKVCFFFFLPLCSRTPVAVEKSISGDVFWPNNELYLRRSDCGLEGYAE
ncbi:hypothetical protein IWX46DRAFT_299892 [Phyllosticta citricarpa]|uniref:Uncharacterized protein n=1 Tax=Phyllosticta citricarpa TaxID=55181 RepID=A0ABR1LJS4_9PEZI